MTARDVSKGGAEATPPRPSPRRGGDSAWPLAGLAAVTGLAALLRLAGIGSDLWLDEIATVLDVRAHSAVELATSFESANRHLLNSLAVAASVGLLGESEWAIRLPAALLGIATVPATYWLARAALGRRESLLAALLVAASYHHVDFSQNARGYAGYLFGGVLATGVLLRRFTRPPGRSAIAYVAAALVAIASVPLALFLVAGHLVAVAVLARSRPLRRAAGAALAPIGVAAVAGALLYAPAWTRAGGYLDHVYRGTGFGAPLLSREHLATWLAGLAGSRRPPLPLLALAAALAVAAWALYARRQPAPAWLLAAPLAVQAASVALVGLRVEPRFFLWAIVVAYFHLVAVAALAAERWDASRIRLPVAVTVVALAPSLALFAANAGVPKQPSRSSLAAAAAERAPGEVVVAVALAKWGARYYAPRVGLVAGRDLFVVETADELAALEAAFGAERLHLLTTFERTLAVVAPDLAARVERDYAVERTFAARVGGAEIRLRRRHALLSSLAARWPAAPAARDLDPER